MIRRPNWDIALLKWAERENCRPFRWGSTDCGTLVRRAVRVIYGRNIFADLKPYRSKRAALRMHVSTGGVEAVLLARGWSEVPLAYAQQGDILVEAEPDENGLPSAGVVVARLLLVSGPTAGVRLIPIGSGKLLRFTDG